ncbi:MAG: dephospho-CoA kinase [Bacteroidetes bacterium GWA2_31_9b]|nr:MAG: dephospho-CoA kinase [Bacteroidetes bacterium GWA2_31_9b]
MHKVGVTGGIGSGKTLVCEVFKRLGISVYNADNEAKNILNSNAEVRKSIENYFGQDIYKNNSLNKKKLAEIIFNNNEAIQKINSIVHPVVRQNFIAWCKSHENKPYVIEEAAIIFESGVYKEFDYTINVFAPEQIRIQRVMERDKATIEDVKKRMQNQMNDDERMKLANFTIINDGTKMIIPQILEIHSKLVNQ